MKNIAIIGSTGSIGTQTLDIVRDSEDMCIVALAAGNNIERLIKQVREFKPKIVAVWKEDKALELKEALSEFNIRIVYGMDGLVEVATFEDADIVVTAIVGMIGIKPTIEAIKAGKDIALANKETLVTAGHIIMPLAKEKGVSILPVDSEHSAIFQCLQGEQNREIHKLIITASGGPFRGRNYEELKDVTVEDALKHPNWSMGKKITIDSATLVNKGLEIIEAKWLFNVELDQVQVVVHPQSIVHSLVEYRDGSILAQLSSSDMCFPIQYAVTWPDRIPNSLPQLDLARLASLHFEAPRVQDFPALSLARQAGITGGTMPAMFNAANEVAVQAFVEGRLSFPGIWRTVETVLSHAAPRDYRGQLDIILEDDAWAREEALRVLG